MAARWWQGVLGSGVAAAVILAALLAHAASLSMPSALVLAVGLLLAAHALSLGLSFFLCFAAAPPAASRGRRLERTLRAFLAEFALFGRAMLCMSTAPWRRPLGLGRPAGGPSRPVLLIHGVLCNGSIWQSWFGPLRARGFGPVKAIDLEPLFADIDTYGAAVAATLVKMHRQSGGARVSIIAHSLGGLVARAALRAVGPAIIAEVVTIASPHRGVAFAHLAPWRPLRQLSPDAPWLRALAADEQHRLAVPFTSIYSLEDNLIPAGSAALEGAQLRELEGLGHVSLLFCPRSIECAIGALTAG